MDRRAIAAVAAVMQLLEETAAGATEEGVRRPAPVKAAPGPSPWALYGRQSIMRAAATVRARPRIASRQEVHR